LTGFVRNPLVSAPEKPASLQILNVTSTSFAISWGFPLTANGILRSFLVTVAETERVDYEHCCKEFPNIEIPVDVEQATYETEVTTALLFFLFCLEGNPTHGNLKGCAEFIKF
jgi:hypothetical protein